MRIIVEGKSNAHRFVNNKWFKRREKFAIITVTTSKTYFNYVDNIVDHLIIPVHDIDEHDKALLAKGDMVLFDSAFAREIQVFVDLNMDKVDFFLIHCDAGVSRSRAVAAALSWVYNGEDLEHFKKGSPNPTIYKVLLNEYGFSNNYDDHDVKEKHQCFMCGRTWVLASGLWNTSFAPERHWT